MAIEKAEKSRGVWSIDAIVREALADLGESGLHRYEQFLMWALRGYRQYHTGISRYFKTVEIEMTAWKAIEIPEDCSKWLRVGFRYNGELLFFTNNPDIPLFHDDADVDGFPDENVLLDSEQAPSGDPDTGYSFNITRRGEDTGGLFGLRAKDNGVGYYRVNKERNEIQLTPIIDRTTVYLEYMASSYDPSKRTLVPEYAYDLIRTYIHKERLKFSRTATGQERAEAVEEYRIEYQRVVDAEDDTTIADILEAAVDSYTASPHF